MKTDFTESDPIFSGLIANGTDPELAQSTFQASNAEPPRRTTRDGYFYIILATLAFFPTTVLLHAAEIRFSIAPEVGMVIRGTTMLALSLVAMPFFADIEQQAKLLRYQNGGWLALAGLTGGLDWLLFMQSNVHLPAGDATAMFFTLPVFSMLFTWLLVGETASLRDVVVAAASIAGGVLVAASGDGMSGEGRLLGAMQAFGAAAAAGLSFAIMRKVGSSAHYLVTTASLSTGIVLIGLLAGGAFDPFELDETERVGFVVMVLSAVMGFVGFAALAVALQLSKAGTVALIRNLDVPLIYILSLVTLHEQVDGVRLLGAFVVVMAAAVIAVGKQ